MPQVGMIFFEVAGGPYGAEPVVRKGGGGFALGAFWGEVGIWAEGEFSLVWVWFCKFGFGLVLANDGMVSSRLQASL